MLQRALDLYRQKFMPSMPPRRHSTRQPTLAALMDTHPPPPIVTPLTTSALSAQNAHYQQQGNSMGAATCAASPAMSCISGTTASLDFADCLSLADETLPNDFMNTTNDCEVMMYTTLPTASVPTSPSSYSARSSPHLLPSFDESSTTVSASSGRNSMACTPSPPVSSELFQLTMDEMYDAFMLPPTASMDDVVDQEGSFMLTDLDSSNQLVNNNNSITKLFDPTFLSSPSLPSSALQQDLLVKMENVDDFTDQLLGTFF